MVIVFLEIPLAVNRYMNNTCMKIYHTDLLRLSKNEDLLTNQRTFLIFVSLSFDKMSENDVFIHALHLMRNITHS